VTSAIEPLPEDQAARSRPAERMARAWRSSDAPRAADPIFAGPENPPKWRNIHSAPLTESGIPRSYFLTGST